MTEEKPESSRAALTEWNVEDQLPPVSAFVTEMELWEHSFGRVAMLRRGVE